MRVCVWGGGSVEKWLITNWTQAFQHSNDTHNWPNMDHHPINGTVYHTPTHQLTNTPHCGHTGAMHNIINGYMYFTCMYMYTYMELLNSKVCSTKPAEESTSDWQCFVQLLKNTQHCLQQSTPCHHTLTAANKLSPPYLTHHDSVWHRLVHTHNVTSLAFTQRQPGEPWLQPRPAAHR